MSTEQFVEVQIGKESYALPILDIHEIIRMQESAEVPSTRKYVRGVINLRGQIIPIISLRERLGLPDIEETKATRIVIVTHPEGIFGMIVDRVNQVVTFASILPPPEQAGEELTYLVKGIGQKGEVLVSILNLENLLGEPAES